MPTQTFTYSQARWSLDDLFPAHNSPEMKAALAELETQVGVFEARREQLTPEIAAAEFLEIVGELESFTRLAYRVSGFSLLKFSGWPPCKTGCCSSSCGGRGWRTGPLSG